MVRRSSIDRRIERGGAIQYEPRILTDLARQRDRFFGRRSFMAVGTKPGCQWKPRQGAAALA